MTEDKHPSKDELNQIIREQMEIYKKFDVSPLQALCMTEFLLAMICSNMFDTLPIEQTKEMLNIQFDSLKNEILEMIEEIKERNGK